MGSPWRVSDRYDPVLVGLADRHYNRQKPGTPQCIPPGTYVALIAADKRAGWITTWPRYRLDEWRGAWINTLFRREGGDVLASEMIRAAVAHTRHRWPAVPALGMITFIDPPQVRRKRDPGRCYLRAGFTQVGVTAKGLLVFQLAPGAMPGPAPVPGTTGELF